MVPESSKTKSGNSGRYYKSLSDSEIKNILTIKGRSGVEPVNPLKKWPGVKNLIELGEAVAVHADMVIFDGDQRFDIYYDKDPKRESVYIKPSTGEFVPCGNFSFRLLRDVKILGQL